MISVIRMAGNVNRQVLSQLLDPVVCVRELTRNRASAGLPGRL